MFNGGSRKRAMSVTLNSVSKQQQHQKQQLSRSLVSNSLISVTNGEAPVNLNHGRNQGARKSSGQLSAKSRSNKSLPMPEADEEEELIVDDDYKPTDLQQNLLNSQLFAPGNSHLEDTSPAQMGNSSSAAIPFNLLSNCQGNKMLNQHHPLAAFAPFQTNGSALNNLGSPMPASCMNDLSLQLNAPNGTSLASHRASGQALNGRATGNGQLDVVQAMLPMLGQEFIWPPHHPLNSLTQLSSLSGLPNQTCSPGLPPPPPGAHLNALLPRQPSANGNLPHKASFPMLYNTPSLLFAHHTSPPSTFGHRPENWLNKSSPVDATSASAFKKVNAANKVQEDGHFPSRKSGAYNDFSVENLSKSKKFKTSNEPKRVKEEEEVDIEGNGDELSRKREIKNEQTDKSENDGYKADDLKGKLPERLNTKRKKANSLGEDRSSEELSDCGSPIRSHSASESNKSPPVFNLLGESAVNCQNDNCQLPCCNKRSSSSATGHLLGNGVRNEPIDSDNKLVDLSNVNTLIKGQESRLPGTKELDLVNNIMAFNNLNKLNEVMNKNYPSNEVLFKEELEKRIQLVSFVRQFIQSTDDTNCFTNPLSLSLSLSLLVSQIEYIRNSFNNANKPEYVHQKLN